MYENIRYMLKTIFSADFGFQEEAAKNIYLRGLISSGKLDEMKAELAAAFEDKSVRWREMLLNDDYEVQDFDTEEESIAYVKRVLWDPLNSQSFLDGAKGGGSGGFSGGKPTIVDDPYSPNAITERSRVNRDYYGRENAADEFSAGLPDYATHSTAKSYQSTVPRDLNERLCGTG